MPLPGPSAQPNSPSFGTLSFSFTIPAKTTSNRQRRPAYVSASTQGLSITVTSQATQSSTTTVVACTSVCTGSVNAPAGVDIVAFKLLDKPPVNGNADPNAKVLAQGSTVTLVVQNQNNMVRATLDGVVKRITMSLAPATVNAGMPSGTYLIVNAYDPDDNLITADGSWVDASGTLVAVDVTAPVANMFAGVAGNVVTVSAPGTLIPVSAALPAGTYSFTATLRSGAPSVSTIAPATLTAQPTVVLGNPPTLPFNASFSAFTLANGSTGIGYYATHQGQDIVADVLGRTLVTGPAFAGPFVGPLVPQPGVEDFASTGGDQAFVLASSTFVSVSGPACAGGASPRAIFRGPVNPSTGAAPFTLCYDFNYRPAYSADYTLQSATHIYGITDLSIDPSQAEFIASLQSDTNDWCGATSCLVLGTAASGFDAINTDPASPNVGKFSSSAPGEFAAYDPERAVGITAHGVVVQLTHSVPNFAPTYLYTSAIQSASGICRTADGTTIIAIGSAIVGGIAQPRIGVFRNGAEVTGPVPANAGFITFVPGSNCKYATGANPAPQPAEVDAVYF
jgi:hypothetical protein